MNTKNQNSSIGALHTKIYKELHALTIGALPKNFDDDRVAYRKAHQHYYDIIDMIDALVVNVEKRTKRKLEKELFKT